MKASFVSALSLAAAVSAASNSTEPLVTSTILATKVYTVTSCAPTVTNCPVGKVTSEILTTVTICPATATFVPAPPATTTPAAGPKTETFYQTKVYTITSCAPTVTNCPVGKVSTEILTSTSVSKPSTSAVAPPVSTGPAGCGGAGCAASVSGNSGKPSSVTYSVPAGSTCPTAITSYVTVTAGASSVPVVPVTAGGNSGSGCGGVGSPACPVTTSTPSKSATCGGAGSPACPVYGTAAPSVGLPKPNNSTVPFTGGAATQKATGLLMAVGIVAALL